MATTREFAAGGYRFIPGPFQYSAGVAALHGYQIQRIRLRQPVPLVRGFELAAETIKSGGRPLTAFCACELRSPAPFTEQGFRAFNEVYVKTLSEWGIFDGTVNPVARSNVCPAINPPKEPSFYAFSYTVTSDSNNAPSLVIAGSGEAPEGQGGYQERCVRRGDVSPGGLREKARFVLGEMERRLGAFGATWRGTTATQVYTVHDLYPFLADEIVRRGAAEGGLTWYFCRPPVVDLDFEMDCRAVSNERVI
ncbi:MAG TPA: hypothetical protein VFB29_05435 [Pseudolabrys sp.]|nr:hypothetical protein [Pseudolabrys sp.]